MDSGLLRRTKKRDDQSVMDEVAGACACSCPSAIERSSRSSSSKKEREAPFTNSGPAHQIMEKKTQSPPYAAGHAKSETAGKAWWCELIKKKKADQDEAAREERRGTKKESCRAGQQKASSRVKLKCLRLACQRKFKLPRSPPTLQNGRRGERAPAKRDDLERSPSAPILS